MPTTSATSLETAATSSSSAGVTSVVDSSTMGSTGEAGVESSGGAGTSTGALEGCGDSLLQPGEQCDLGFAGNFDTGECTSKCRLLYCGDGFVWADHEACDNAESNNDTIWGGCRTDCSPGPGCGDAVVQPGHEECDDGPEWNGAGESKDPDHAPCTAECRLSGRLFFVTSDKYTGDLNGLPGADDLCRGSALDAGLDNHLNFVAWLSDAALSPVDRIPHADQVGIPFVMPGGLLVADDWDDLVTNGPRFGVHIDEHGQPHEDDPFAWTNTKGDGTPFSTSQHCLGWLSGLPSQVAMYGKGYLPMMPMDAWLVWKSERRWSAYDSDKCDKAYRLYCVEK